MLRPMVCIDQHLTTSIKRSTAIRSLGKAFTIPGKSIRTLTRRMALEELPRIARQEIPAFRVYQKGPC